MTDLEKRLSKLEMDVMRSFWKLDRATAREAYEELSASRGSRVEYTTVQTIVGRLEAKGAVEKIKKVGNAWLYRALVTRKSVVGKLVDEVVNLLEGAVQPIVSHLVESGRMSKEELSELERLIEKSKEEETSDGN